MNPRFQDLWPDVAQTVIAVLRRRRVPEWLVDEVVQETGIKLWKMWDEVDPGRSVAALATTIAVNLVADHWRGFPRWEIPGDVPDRAAPSDTEREVLARAQLGVVARALGKLRPSLRNVLLAEAGVGGYPVGRSSSALRMMRLRARRELTALVDRAGGFGVVVASRIRHSLRAVTGRVSSRLGPRETDAVAYLVVSAFVVATSFGAVVPASERPRSPARPETDLVATGQAPVLVTSIQLDAGTIARDLRDLANRATRLLDLPTVDRPLAKGRIGRLGYVAAEGSLDIAGLRVGTKNDGSAFFGCSDGTETGPTGLTRCELRPGRTQGRVDVDYRLGTKEGTVTLRTGRIND